MAPLRRPHADGREPLHQFKLTVSSANGVLDVLDLQVLVKVDKISTARVRHQRYCETADRALLVLRHIDRIAGKPKSLCGCRAGLPSSGQDRRQREISGDGSGKPEMRRN